MANEGDLRVWTVVNPPAAPSYYPVESPDHALRVIESMIIRQGRNPSIWMNVHGLQVYDGDEWAEWYSDDGEDINDWGGEEGER